MAVQPSHEAPGVPVAPEESAQAAGVRYVSDTHPGIRRRRAGRGFCYHGLDGRPIRDPAVLRRIKALAIPPAWTDVWICPRPDGHLQATGRDGRGRKQYRYHPRWRAVRDATKYDRMMAFGDVLPQLRVRLEQDMALPGLPRAKVLATVVRLLETTLIRVGNLAYARANSSFGLTTLRDRHVQIAGATLQFHFRGKSGRDHTVRLHDRRLATIVKRCQELPGYELFQYLDATGERQTVDSADVNAYLRQLTGRDFTAKDVRTWAGTVLAACTLRACGPWTSQTEVNKRIVQAIDAVAKRLGNTRAVCRACYVHPTVLEAYRDGSLCTLSFPTDLSHRRVEAPGLPPEEAMTLALLKQRSPHPVRLRQQAR